MAVGEGNAGLAFASEGIFGSIPKALNSSVGCETTAVTVADTSAQIPNCPNGCVGGKIFRDGKRYNKDGSVVQRYVCSRCGERFSDKALKSQDALTKSRQICAKGAKNLHALTPRKHVGTGEVNEETRAIVRVFEGWLQKNGYKKNHYPDNIITIAYLGADLMNPEDVKAKIAGHNVRDGMKMLLCYAYEAFLRMNKMTWERPGGRRLGYKQDEIIPFVPEEAELDQLIASARSKRMAAFLQTMKETFTDPSEALRINRKEDVAGRYITIRHPVKNHRPRTLEVSEKCIAMLNMLPQDSERFFDCTYSNVTVAFRRHRRNIARKMHNDRFEHIELTSYRTWAGTRIAELSNGNPITVMKMLGIKNIDNAMRYINIWKLSFKSETEYEFLEVTTPEELKLALLGGYTHVIDKFGASWFRRPKRLAVAGTPIPERPDLPQCPPLEAPLNRSELQSGSNQQEKCFNKPEVSNNKGLLKYPKL